MSVGNKKTLSTVVYYTLAAITLAFAAFFVYALIVRDDVAMWAKVVYFIWIALVIGTIVFDVVCSSNGEGKTISGLLVYVLSLLALIVAIILYFVNTGANGLATEFFNLFISISLLSILTTGFMIATWVVGEHLIQRSTENKELENTKM